MELAVQGGVPVASPPRGATPPPAATTDEVPAAHSRPISAGACSSHSSSHLGSMFQLSPEVQGLAPAGLPQAEGSLSHELAMFVAQDADGGSDSEAGDDLSSFLADLKSKYGLNEDMDHSGGPLAVSVSVVLPSPGTRSGSPPPLTLPLPPPSPQHWSVNPLWHSRAVSPEAAGAGRQLSASASGAHRLSSEHDGDMVSALPQPWWQEPVPPAGQLPGSSSQAHNNVQPLQQPAQGAEGQERESSEQRQEEQEVQPGLDGGAKLDVELSVLEELQRRAAADQLEQDQRQAASSSNAGAGTGQGGISAAGGEPGLGACGQPPQRQLPWQSLHTLLVQRGFPGLLSMDDEASSRQPDPAAVFEALHSLVREHARCAAHQQRLTEAAQLAARREGALLASFAAASKQKEGEIAKWKRLALENQVAARDAQRSRQQCRGASDQLAAEARQMEGLVSRQQHALSVRDAEVERLKQVIAAQREREERRQRADCEAYERLKRGYAASKAESTPGGAAAALRAACRELKPLDLMRIFEAERANLQEAAAAAAAEARAAQAQLARAQEALHAAGLPCEMFEEVEGQARAAARQAAVAEERAAQLAEEASALRQELAARPTQAQLDSVKRQAGIMERQLAKAAADKAAAESKEAKSRPRPKQLSTREMILRDRSMQRLGLHSVEELPKPVLVEVVQDACALLECRQPLELCAAMGPVQDLAALVPRMERFIGDVCGAVFQRGLAHVPEALRQDNPSDVPAILAAWIAELSELVEMRGVLRALLRHLASRVSVQPCDPPLAAGEVVPLVASLVELERKVYHSREVIEAAETALAAQPDLLINRICLQFQRLFGCRSLEGILPAMNKLYLAHTEAQTFLALLRAALGLEAAATLEACANRLEQLLADRRESLATMLPARDPHAAAVALPASAHAVVVEVAPRRDLQQAAQVAVERMAAKRKWPKVQIYVPAGGEDRVGV